MSKTYADQVTKAQMLVAGLKKNYESIQSRGITLEQIHALETAANEAAVMNKEVEALREEVSIKAAKANKKLTEIKNNMHNAKQVIKRCFDQERWIDTESWTNVNHPSFKPVLPNKTSSRFPPLPNGQISAANHFSPLKS